jgi:hypothetical protein
LTTFTYLKKERHARKVVGDLRVTIYQAIEKNIIKYDLSFEIRIVILVTPKGKKHAINSQGYRRGKLAKINEVFA